MKMKKGVLKLKRVLFLLVLLATLVAMNNGGLALAQTGGDPWSPPINLSRSGSTSNPVAVRDAKGIIHVIWQDEIAGSVYSRLKDDQWSQPYAIKFPFGKITPRLLADGRGFIHAFWINSSGSLVYSRLSPTSNALSGEKALILAKAALAFDVTIDMKDRIHLAYVSSLDAPGLPAGVYYRRSVNAGGNWEVDQLLYPSQYFRGLDRAAASISIASAGEGATTRIYVAWDNRPRKRVFFSMSTDVGQNWSEPKEIQGESASVDTASPYGIEVGANSYQVMLLWLTNDPTIGCRQSYQMSADGGESWTSPSAMPTDVIGCPQNSQFLTSGNLFILMTSIQDQLYLLAWNGKQWSNPEFQRTLTGFEDPETQEMVLYACQNPILLPDGQLLVVGCDGGIGKDIWATNRPISDMTLWFPPASVWNSSSQIAESNSLIASPELVADSQGGFHAIWIQAEAQAEGITPASSKSVVYYAGYDGSSWSRPIKILSSPTGDADQPSLTIDAQDRLMVVWHEIQSGSIYFSWANAGKAANPSEWANPSALPTIQPVAVSPIITTGSSGVLYVVFAIPINEERGIYITSSADAGQTWSKPTRVVDAVAAGWEMVDQPQIGVSADGRMHVMWRVVKVIGENVPLGIYYARSEDDGHSWSNPGSLMEGPVYWYQMAFSEESSIHVVWQEDTFRGYGLKQQVSTDGGQTWSRPETIIDLGTSPVPASLVGSYGNQASLLFMAEEPLNKQVLKQWAWEGDRWSEASRVDLVDDQSLRVRLLSAALYSQGKLGVIYNTEGLEKAGGQQDVKLLYSERKVEPGAVLPTLAATQIIQSINTIAPTETATITPEPTQAITSVIITPTQPAAQERSNRDTFTGVAIIVVITGIVSGLIILLLRKNWSQR